MAAYDIEAFSKRLKEAREALGLSRAEFARRTGVTPTAVWNWEEANARPKRDALKKIASVLGVSEAFLTTGSKLDETEGSEARASEMVPGIIEAARQKVAIATGIPLSRVRISVEFHMG
ncbi:MAG: helix-turn-helix transcriptional regulator [Alphaproteobacteria bacterium]|nr:helix-turn-helix transcriptional regulator [Alphaproteobacteria bacterium]MBV9862507.1 helix-turn-helix transcriptional regulator [Alphaproteobacteria bacterium]